MSSQMIVLIIALVVILAANGAVVFLMLRKREEKPQNEQGLNLLLTQLNELNRTMDQKISDLNKTVDHRITESSRDMNQAVRSQFGESQKLVDKFIKEITTMTQEVTSVKETGKQMVGFADQLQSLQDILKNPKQRGILGEYYLETLLKNVLPPGSFQMQYKLGIDEKTGQDTIVDAAVFVKDKIIPVDSKFSLENYNRIVEERDQVEKDRLEKVFVNDLKNRILETSKYIQPSKNTMEFAFMFIPHEAIYYDLLVNKIGVVKGEDTENLIQRAASKYKVIIVSPTSFLAYLQTVLQGLKAMQIEETAKDIVKRVEELGKHLKSYEDYHNKLGRNLETVVNQYVSSSKELKKVDKDVLRITGVSAALDPVLIDKPIREDE